MSIFYAIAKTIWRFVHFNCVRAAVLHRDRFDQKRGFVLAITHLSHLEPLLLAALVDRPIDYMARMEFYRSRIARVLLNAVNAFPVKRQGIPVRAIRTAIDRVGSGRIIGIFPEGGVVRGNESAMLGGPIKRGACLLARRAGVPIIPVAMVGTEDLSRITPWLPFRRIKLHVIFGNAIHADPNLPRRQDRFRMADELSGEFQRLYSELKATYGCCIKTSTGAANISTRQTGEIKTA